MNNSPEHNFTLSRFYNCIYKIILNIYICNIIVIKNKKVTKIFFNHRVQLL